MPEEKTSKKSVLLVATFAAFLTPFLGSAVNLALPSIGKDLNANAIQLGWVISSFILSSAIFLLPFGRFADIIGRKKIFSLGISSVYNFNLSYYFLAQHYLPDNFKGIPGFIECNDLWHKPGNYYICF